MADIYLLISLLTPLLLGVLTLLTEIARRNSQHTAQQVQLVADNLSISATQTDGKLDTIHTLVNSRLTEALAKIDRLESRLHDITGEEPSGEPQKS